MEDWQEWQIRADQVAAELSAEADDLEKQLPTDNQKFNARAFWPRFRDLKEKVRLAPAIQLEAKLELERRLRSIGAQAYKAQEAVNAQSSERRQELLDKIASLRSRAEGDSSPRSLRSMRREFDSLRDGFDKGTPLSPADRQVVWDAWREANQAAWQRLNDLWASNEVELRSIVDDIRPHAERGNTGGVRQGVSRFFDTLKSREAKQEAVNEMKAQIDDLRRQAEEAEQKAANAKAPKISVASVPVADTWRSELARNRESLVRLREEVAELERQIEESDSILDQSVLRGTLAERRRKVTELERANRVLEQKIEQTEETPLIPTA